MHTPKLEYTLIHTHAQTHTQTHTHTLARTNRHKHAEMVNAVDMNQF